MFKISRIKDFQDHTDRFDYVSFDLFDTLIKRKYLSVYEVHQAAGMYAQALLGYQGERSPEEMASLRYEAATELKDSTGSEIQEPSIAQVWDRLLAQQYDITDNVLRASLVRQIVDFELEMELANLGLIEGVSELLQNLKRQGKTVVAISDMYFDKAQMMVVLEQLNILHYFDHLFVSAEQNLTKQTGDLFLHVLSDLGIQPDQMLHVGDNPHSDIAMAITAGLQCVHVEQYPFLELERSAFGQRERIEHEVADIVKAHLFSVLVDGLYRNVEHIYFLARDGLAIESFLKAWDSPFRDKFLPVPGCSPLYLNRALMCWAEIDLSQPDWLRQAVGKAFWLKEGQATAEDLCRLLGVEKIPPELHGRLLTAASDTHRVAEALYRSGAEENIRNEVTLNRRKIERHLHEVGFFEKKSVALVDVGYSGTVGRLLNGLLVLANAEGREIDAPKIILHLIATYSNYEINRAYSLPNVHFANQALLPIEALPDELHGYSWIELFFKHRSLLPILRFVEQDGKLVPDLKEGEPYPGETPADRVRAFASGRAEDIVFLWMALTGRFEALTRPVIARFAAPDPATIEQMRDEIFELDPIEGTRRSILLEMHDVDDETLAAAARRGDYWIAGSVAASRLPRRNPNRSKQRRNPLVKLGQLLGMKPKDNSVSPEFDPEFYHSFYPDLRHFRSSAELLQHYLTYGRKERRLSSRRELETRLQAECGVIPADFSPYAYLHYNPDIALVIDTPERALDHYMRNGMGEGRRYSPQLDELTNEFETLLALGRITLSPEEVVRHSLGTSALRIFLSRHDISVGPWIDYIDVAEFRAMHATWAGPVTNRAECIRALCECGLDRMPALSFRAQFDPDYYCQQEASLQRLNELERYRHFLNQGSALGFAPSESAALLRLWGNPDFPDCFDWAGWRDSGAAIPKSTAPQDRVAIFAAFLNSRDEKKVAWLKGAGASQLLLQMAHKAWRQGFRQQAQHYLEQSLSHRGECGEIYHAMADLARESGEHSKAIAYYRKGIASPRTNRWSYLNAADLLLQAGNHQAALDILETGRDAWQFNAVWRELKERALNGKACAYARRLASVRTKLPNLQEADLIVSEIAKAIDGIGPLDGRQQGVLVVTSRAVPSRSSDGFADDVTVVPSDLGTDYLLPILQHEVVIFHEPLFNYTSIRAIQTARRLGKHTILWLGDLTEWQGKNLDHLVWGEWGGEWSHLRSDTIREMALMARWCDRAVVTFPGCTRILAALAPEVSVTEIPRSLPKLRGEPTKRKVVLVAPTGHAKMTGVERLAEALVNAGKADARIEFIVDRRLSGLRTMRHLADRKSELEDNLELSNLAGLVALVDAVIAFQTDELPEFSIFDAALAHGVPIIQVLSQSSESQENGTDVPSDSLLQTVRFGVDDLPTALQQAISRPVLNQSVPSHHQKFATAIPDNVSASVPATVRRRRLLITNVWAPPQLIGGATRVMKDNVDYILDHHRDEFEIALFASDEGNNKCGQLSADTYRGVPVFRVATPVENNIYWRPVNKQAAARFKVAIESFMPDLVHFHCLQKLGVGLPEVCWSKSIPYIVTLHDGWWLSDEVFLSNAAGVAAPTREDFFDQPRSPLHGVTFSSRRAQRLRASLHRAVRQLAVSKRFAEVYEGCGFNPIVLENGASRLEPVVWPARGVDGRVELCHIGGLETHKGAFLIEAALRGNQYHNLRFTVIDLAREAGYRHDTVWGDTPVTILGRIPPDQLPEFYAQMDVLLTPSVCEESFGLVSREALANGLWVVAGDRGAIGDPVQEGMNGFIVPVIDSTGIAGALRHIDADPERFRKSPPAFGELRTADDQSRELAEIYRSLISAPGL